MSLSLEKINKGLLILALASLIYRVGNFAGTFIPKPFEIVFLILALLTLAHLIKDKKFIIFFNAVPTKVWVTLSVMVVATLCGWVISIFAGKVSTTFNSILEFVSYCIAIGAFLLILFYTRDGGAYFRWCFFCLLIPVIYVVVVLFPSLADYLHLTQSLGGNFIGLTTNANIISKTLLIPAIFFATIFLFDDVNRHYKWLGSILYSLTTTLILWTASRGALLSLILATGIVWVIFVIKNLSWKKALISGVSLALLFSIGFMLTPSARKKVVINRALNSDTSQLSVREVQNRGVIQIFKESIENKFTRTDPQNSPASQIDTELTSSAYETRLQIWMFYLSVIIKNPLGVGPHTHMESNIVNKYGGYLSSGPHNTYFQMWLWGGILGLLGFLYLLWLAFSNLIKSLRKNFNLEAVALLGILFALLVSMTFDDGLTMFSFWATLALAIRKK